MPESCENKTDNVRNYSFTRGDTFTLNFIYRSRTGPIDITNAAIYMTVKNTPTDSAFLFQLTVGSGVTITDAINGKYSITIPKTATFPLDCNRAYPYDVVVELNATDRETVLKGAIILKQNITST